MPWFPASHLCSENDSKIFQVWLIEDDQTKSYYSFANCDAHVRDPAEPFANIGKGRGRNCGRSPGGSSLNVSCFCSHSCLIASVETNSHKFTGFFLIFLISTTEHVHVGLKLSADRSKYRRTKSNQTQSMAVTVSWWPIRISATPCIDADWDMWRLVPA